MEEFKKQVLDSVKEMLDQLEYNLEHGAEPFECFPMMDLITLNYDNGDDDKIKIQLSRW